MSATFAYYGIETKGRAGTVKTACPKCGPGRSKPQDPCLSADTDKGVWNCHRCGFKGSLGMGLGLDRPKVAYKKPNFTPVPLLHPSLVAWGESRGLSVATLERAKLKLTMKYFPQVEAEVQAIQFPYFRGGECVNIKSRGLEDKVFTQEAGAEKVFYGLDDLGASDWAVIVEGEVDKLSFGQAGVWNCLSVPDGAPPEGSAPSDKKFEYIPNCEQALAHLVKIILAVDNDGPGKTLEAELARRLGPERCYTLKWPEGTKDANEALLARGRPYLASAIESATAWPIAGIVEPWQVVDDLEQLYEKGAGSGESTGWRAIDKCYTVAPGELSIVTGLPGHGKSEWLDALMVNMAKQHGWHFAVCSPENFPVAGHVAKILEKYTGKPFALGPTPRMSWSDLAEGVQWVQNHLVFFSPAEECVNIEEVLRLAKISVTRYGIRGLVIDPWNEFDHQRGPGMSETEYIGAMLTKIRRFARNHAVHVWIIAHPMKLKKLENGGYPVPTPYDINGSANWRNKADNCLAIYRDPLSDDDRAVQVYIQKIRFRYHGKIGTVELYWNPVNGRYS